MTEEQLDRFSRGELPPEEARALAQRALDDPELFDEATFVSLARVGLTVRRPKRSRWPLLAMIAAAAAILAVALVGVVRRPATPAPAIARAGEPILLARNETAAASFRSAEGDVRAPRQTGSVVSVENGSAAIDLGAVDGLAKGGEVELPGSGARAKMLLTTIFRDHARGEIPAALTLRPGDRVRVPDKTFLTALLDQIDSLTARGDSAGARRVAEQAAALTAELPSQNYADLNNLAVIAELRGDKTRAQSLYSEALAANPSAGARRSIELNLARVKGVK